jgi:hypothetical protein
VVPSLILLLVLLAVAWLIGLIHLKQFQDTKLVDVGAVPGVFVHHQLCHIFIRPQFSTTRTQLSGVNLALSVAKNKEQPQEEIIQCYYDDDQVSVESCLLAHLPKIRSNQEAISLIKTSMLDS